MKRTIEKGMSWALLVLVLGIGVVRETLASVFAASISQTTVDEGTGARDGDDADPPTPNCTGDC